MKRPWILLATLVALSAGFARRPAELHVTLLHFNDVYEITPVQGGKAGGMARVAAIRKELKRRDPNLITILGGDLFSPSALGTAKVDGQPLAGKQMVAVLNAMGLDLCTFGNHEFDLKEEQFLARLRESKFAWFSTNCRDAEGKPFPNVPDTRVIRVRTPGGPLRLGFLGVTVDANKAAYVSYLDAVKRARATANALRRIADVVVAVTHLNAVDDAALAEAVPEIDLILGGHDHENMQLLRGAHFTPILKADANVRSLYIVDLAYDTATHRVHVNARVRPVTDSDPEDPAVAAVVRGWQAKGFEAFRKAGFQPEQVVAVSPEALEATEAAVRNRPTNLAELIARSMLAEYPAADCALYNAGSIRIDDVLPPGPITQYDVIRILPFGGKVMQAEMKGRLLARVLDQGVQNRGEGGFLQMTNVTRSGSDWLIKGETISPDRVYRVVTNDFLMSGREQGLEMMKPPSADIGTVTEGRDVRQALIAELRRRWPPSSRAYEIPGRRAYGRPSFGRTSYRSVVRPKDAWRRSRPPAGGFTPPVPYVQQPPSCRGFYTPGAVCAAAALLPGVLHPRSPMCRTPSSLPRRCATNRGRSRDEEFTQAVHNEERSRGRRRRGAGRRGWRRATAAAEAGAHRTERLHYRHRHGAARQ